MKKLSLLKLNDPKVLEKEELKKVKGGNCSDMNCQCNGSFENGNGSAFVDQTLDFRETAGYHN